PVAFNFIRAIRVIRGFLFWQPGLKGLQNMSQDIFDQIHNLSERGEPFALATIVRVVKPISAKPGDKGIITRDGSLQGWVGGGCSQDIIIREAKKVINEAEPRFLRLVGSGAIAEKSEG